MLCGVGTGKGLASLWVYAAGCGFERKRGALLTLSTAPATPPAGCLPWCMTPEGAHMGNTAYEAATQILVNMLMQLPRTRGPASG